jgi:hypothetical protein
MGCQANGLHVKCAEVSRRPPRHYFWVTPWRDGEEAKLYGEVFARFIKGWLQTGVDRRRVKGV